mgnify:CR=1 FL=1
MQSLDAQGQVIARRAVIRLDRQPQQPALDRTVHHPVRAPRIDREFTAECRIAREHGRLPAAIARPQALAEQQAEAEIRVAELNRLTGRLSVSQITSLFIVAATIVVGAPRPAFGQAIYSTGFEPGAFEG